MTSRMVNELSLVGGGEWCVCVKRKGRWVEPVLLSQVRRQKWEPIKKKTKQHRGRIYLRNRAGKEGSRQGKGDWC